MRKIIFSGAAALALIAGYATHAAPQRMADADGAGVLADADGARKLADADGIRWVADADGARKLADADGFRPDNHA
jgi:hypothetical protein